MKPKHFSTINVVALSVTLIIGTIAAPGCGDTMIDGVVPHPEETALQIPNPQAEGEHHAIRLYQVLEDDCTQETYSFSLIRQRNVKNTLTILDLGGFAGMKVKAFAQFGMIGIPLQTVSWQGKTMMVQGLGTLLEDVLQLDYMLFLMDHTGTEIKEEIGCRMKAWLLPSAPGA